LDPFLVVTAILTLAVVLLLVLLGLLHLVYFSILPRRAIKREKDSERLRGYLERVVATPSLFGPAAKLVARHALAKIYFGNRKYAEASTHYGLMLEALSGSFHRGRNKSLEASIRRQLADCLEAVGQVEDAAQEREHSAELLDHAPEDTLAQLTHGKLLQRQNRHEEAYAAFQKALELAPIARTKVRIECMVHMLLAAYNAGRPSDCLHLANEAIELGATGVFLRSARKMAAVACGSLGRLEESERHYRHAYDAAAAEHDTGAMAEIAGWLANCLWKRGKLVEAKEACSRAVAMDPKAARVSLSVEADIFHDQGRYDEALAAVARCKEIGPLVTPSAERRVQAIRALGTARILAECSRGEDAWIHIQQALEVLKDDAKLGLMCEASTAWVLAAMGHAEDSRRLAASVENRLSSFKEDPSTCRSVLYDLGMAACASGDYLVGVKRWTLYMTQSPDPIYHPSGHFHRGECFRCLGQLIEANHDYRAAVAMNFDTHFTRLARRRLAGFTDL
jgi:tetratricopeptide (TPR) repeat protein